MTPGRGRAACVAVGLLVLLVSSQRIGIPVGDSYVSPALGFMYLVVGAMLICGRAVVEQVRLLTYLVAAAAVLLATLWVGLSGGSYSITSVGLLVVAYLPLCVVATNSHHLRRVLVDAFARVMTVLAVVAILQMAAQLVGVWTYRDFLAEVLPAQLLVDGYVTTYPVTFGSPIMRSNAFVFLEPSFCSQFLALGALLHLLGRRRAQAVLCAGALLTTFSGTGLILLAVGVALVALQARARVLLPSMAAASVAVALVALSPIGAVYADRLSSFSDESSSGYQRFVAPYARIGESLQSSVGHLLAGGGAGSAQQLVERVEAATGQPAIDPPHAKLVVEYGLPAGLLFVAFALVVFIWRTRSAVTSAAVVTMYFFLSGSLLQVQTLAICWLLTGFVSGLRTVNGLEQPAWSRPPGPRAVGLP